MAAVASHDDESDSDFGYDFTLEDEHLLLQLTARPAPSPATVPLNDVTAAIDEVPGRTEILISGDPTISNNDGAQGTNTGLLPPEVESREMPSPIPLDDIVAYSNLGQTSQKDSEQGSPEETAVKEPESSPDEDTRPPIQRFRSFPRRPLTVTDLTSGAWCELQYWYTLTRLPGGRRTINDAMKQGSKVHKKLEDEVHTTIPVEVITKEDRFGLKLWNFIQGLRTLREKGLTRELEIWGTIDGNLVNGVIDELSHQNPNPEFEAELSKRTSKRDVPSQSSLTDYFPSKRKAQTGKKVYLADVKTRGTLTPVSKALLRPAKIQLLLYHRFLADMASGQLDFFKVLRRYGLNIDVPFSDTFLAQIAGLHEEIFVDIPHSQDQPPATSEDSADRMDELYDLQRDVLNYQSLRELITLVKEELATTFPDGEDSIGHILNVRYIYRGDGREIDTHDFAYSGDAMKDYLSNYMPWWRGEREANGVQIEEAFKCRTCEFVGDCSWRQKMDDQRVQNARRKAAFMDSIKEGS